MEKYNYYREVTNDIECWMDANDFDLSEFKNREEAAEFLEEKLWTEDSVTGNGFSFLFNEEDCEEFLCHNANLIIDACDTFGVDYNELRRRYDQGMLAQYLDCTIRCYVLPVAINSALASWEDYGHEYAKTQEDLL